VKIVIAVTAFELVPHMKDTPAPFAETAQRAAAPSIPSGHITVLVCTPVIYSRWFEDGKKQRGPFLCATRRRQRKIRKQC